MLFKFLLSKGFLVAIKYFSSYILVVFITLMKKILFNFINCIPVTFLEKMCILYIYVNNYENNMCSYIVIGNPEKVLAFEKL